MSSDDLPQPLQGWVDAVAPFARATVVRIPVVSDTLEGWAAAGSAAAGLDDLTMRSMIWLFGAIPLGLLSSLLPRGYTQHVFNLVVGIVLTQYVYGVMWVHSFLSALGAYLAVTFLGRHRSTPLLVFVWSILYVLGAHFYRIWTDYEGWSLDFTGPQMVLTLKISSIAFNVGDGNTRRKELEAVLATPEPAGEKEKKALAAKKRVAKDQLALSLTSAPDPLQYFGWIYCPLVFFTGPAFEITEYLRATEKGSPGVSGLTYADVDPKMAEAARGASPVTSRLLRAGSRILMGVVFMGVTMFAMAKFNFSDKEAFKAFFALPSEWDFSAGWVPVLQALLTRVGYIQVWMFFVRFKYYFAWCIAEGACVLAGYGYLGSSAGKDESEWGGVEQVDVLGCELAQNFSGATRAWNKFTQKWLERYTYVRLPASYSIYVLYFVSAIWHGPYPGYFLFFMSAPFATNVARMAREVLRPLTFADAEGKTFKQPAKTLYDIVSWVATISTLNMLAVVFVLLTYEKGSRVWSSIAFLPHILIALAFLTLTVLKGALAKPKPKEPKEPKEPKKEQ